MLIDRFFVKGRSFLGCRYPIMCGAMTWASDPQLVSAIGNAGGFPRKNEIAQAKQAGARVLCFASTEPLAMILVDRGADALKLEGSEAGGHIGPIALSVLIQQILFQVDIVPIFIAGGIATGRMMGHLLMMGPPASRWERDS